MSKPAPTTGPAPAATPGEPAGPLAAADGTVTPDASTDAAGDGTTPPKAELTPEQLVEKNRKANAEAKALRERNKVLEADRAEFEAWKESQKTEEQRANERTQALEAENAALKRAALITRVQAATNLPDSLVERLRGETEEELLEDAKTLAALVTPPAAPPVPPNPGQQVPPASEPVGDPRQTAAKAWLKTIGR